MKIRKGAAILLAFLMLTGILPAAAPATVRAEQDWVPTDTYCPSDRDNYRHYFLDWEVFMDATCTWDGDMVRRCYFCGYEQHQRIPATGHDFGSWTTVLKADCTHSGQEVRTCNECGEEETREIPAKGHTYGAWETLELPTCTKEGRRRRTCTVCGYIQMETIAKIPHVFDTAIVELEPTCQIDGTSRRTCTVCGYVERQTIARLPHNVENWSITVPMTPFSYGRREGTCSMCGQIQTEDLIPLGILRRGDRGGAVEKLQNSLNAAGYNCGTADGAFGGNTEMAVSAFESFLGVTQDGIAWPGVQNALYNMPETPGSNGAIVLSLHQISPVKDAYPGGEELTFELVFANYTGHVIKNWDVFVSENVEEMGEPSGWTSPQSEKNTNIAPGETFTTLFKYTVTDLDVVAGGEALHWYLAGELDDGTPAFSNTYDLGFSTMQAAPQAPDAAAEEPENTENTDTAESPGTPGEAEPAEGSPESGGIGGGGESSLAVHLEYLGPAVESFGKGGTVEVPAALVNDSDEPKILANLTCDMEDEIVYESWMDQPLEPHKTNHFTLRLKVEDADLDNMFLKGQVDAIVHDQYTGEYAGDHLDITIARKINESPGIIVIPEDTSGLKANPGDEIPVECTVINNGNCDMKLKYLEVSVAGTSVDPTDKDNYTIPAEYFDHFAQGDSFKFTYNIVVRQEDVDNKVVHRNFWLYASDKETDTKGFYAYQIKIAMEGGEEPALPGMSLIMVENSAPGELSLPGDSSGYLGTATYYGIIENTGNVPIEIDELMVYMYPDDTVPVTNLTFSPELILMPEESAGFYTKLDMYSSNLDPSNPNQDIVATFYATALEPGSKTPYPDCEVTWWFAYKVNGEPAGPPELTVKKEVISTPKYYSEGYTEGEFIDYAITVTNESGQDIGEVIVYDPLKGSNEDMVVDMIVPLKASSSETVYFSHEVTAEDVDIVGYVENTASIEWMWGNEKYEAESNTVIVPTYRPPVKIEEPEPTPEPTPEPQPAADYCKWILTGLGEGQKQLHVEICAEHKALQDQSKELVQSAKTPEELTQAMGQLSALWTDAVNAEYDELIARSKAEDLPVIVNEKAMFYAHLAEYKELLRKQDPGDPYTAEYRIAELLMKKCTEMCYELHTAPESRLDSRITGSYSRLPDLEVLPEICQRAEAEDETGLLIQETLSEEYKDVEDVIVMLTDKAEDAAELTEAWHQAQWLWQMELTTLQSVLQDPADEEAAKLYEAENESFEKWYGARTELLDLLYPERSDITSEVLAETLRSRIIDLTAN